MSGMNLVNFDRGHNNDNGDNNDNIDSALHHALQHDLTNFDHEQLTREKGTVPIDPSIGTASEKEAAVAAAAAAANAANAFARTTAQAAVQSSKTRQERPAGPKVTKPRVNKPGQKFGAKKKSWVWNWFMQDPDDCNLATCDYCGKSIRRLNSDKGSPKKLGEHLKTHKIDKDSVNQRRDHLMVDTTDRPFFNTLNTTAASFKPHPLSNEATNEPEPEPEEVLDLSAFDQSPYTDTKFQKEVMKFVQENKLSREIVKSHSFRQVVYTLRPNAIADLNELEELFQNVIGASGMEQVQQAQEKEQEDQQQLQHQQSVHDDMSEKNNELQDLGNATDGWV